jgi:Fe2+ transport system protein B
MEDTGFCSVIIVMVDEILARSGAAGNQVVALQAANFIYLHN